ncbi:MAG: sulfite exporter TauE/SafE family protein [Clostridia bacterium]|nr:sulfite exporter TauE/SafE family protein [Clostridia bacterium]
MNNKENKKIKVPDTKVRYFIFLRKIEKRCETMVYVIGLIGGFVSGFFGAGGGLILLPAMVNILKVDEYKARGTTLASIFVATLIASIFYAQNNYFDMSLSLKLAIGGIVGGFLGAKITNKIPKDILAIAFNIFLLYVSIRMIFAK